MDGLGRKKLHRGWEVIMELVHTVFGCRWCSGYVTFGASGIVYSTIAGIDSMSEIHYLIDCFL